MRCEIARVNEQILKKVLALIQTAHWNGRMTIEENGRLGGEYAHGPIKVDIAIKSPQLKDGFGLNFRDGKGLRVIGEHTQEFDRLHALIISTYEVIAAQEALKSMGYDVDQPLPVAGTNRIRLKAARKSPRAARFA